MNVIAHDEDFKTKTLSHPLGELCSRVLGKHVEFIELLEKILSATKKKFYWAKGEVASIGTVESVV